MGIVVCIIMLLGLSVLQPTPWDSSRRAQYDPKFVICVALLLCGVGLWNVIFGLLKIDGFWMWASLVSGAAMMFGAGYIFSEQNANFNTGGNLQVEHTGMRKVVVIVLALSFLLYAVTLIQLNLGYSIVR